MALVYAGLVHAEIVNDERDDIWHWKWNSVLGSYYWEKDVSIRPNIDIKEISCTIKEGQLILEMKVYGVIENSDNMFYYIYYNTTDASYMIWYSNGTGMYVATYGSGGAYGENVTASGNTITATIPLVSTGEKKELWGYAQEWAGDDRSGEYWGDWAPQSTSPWYGSDENVNGNGSDDGGDKKGIPGFEMVLLAGIIAAILLIRRWVYRA